MPSSGTFGNKSKTGYTNSLETINKIKSTWTKKKKALARKRAKEWHSKPENLEKIAKQLRGNKNPNWQNGLSQTKYKGFYPNLKKQIRKRDNYICQKCGKTEKELGYKLSINHIDFDKSNCSKDNLNALCKKCNSIINFDRVKWTKIFQIKIKQLHRKPKNG